MSARNKFLIVLGIILTIAAGYYFFSTPGGHDLVLVGTVDANQIVVSPQIQGRILKLLVEEGTQVKQGDVANSQARLQAARAQLAQAEATLARVESDSRRTIGLAQAGVASEQEKVQAEMNLKAQEASVQALRDQVTAGQADLKSAMARTNQATAAQSTVASQRAQVDNAVAQLKEAEVRLGYTKIYAPVTGTVLVRAAREGEVVNAGQAIVTVVDFSDTWVLAAIPETDADHIGLGDTLRVRLPGGTVIPGKVFYKAAAADFATQRDVGRRKRDIRTIGLKVRLENPKGAYVPGMTAEVLVSPEQLKGAVEAAGKK